MSEQQVTVRIKLSKKQYETLDRLRELCGHKTLEQTIRSALKLYKSGFRLTRTDSEDE